MASLQTYRDKLNLIVKDDAAVYDEADQDFFLKQAFREYGKRKPRIRTALLTGDGTATEFAVPTGWERGFSVVYSFEHPVDERPKQFLDEKEDWDVIDAVSGSADIHQIQTVSFTLTSGETARVRYTVPHTVDATSSSIIDNDFDAVAALAGSHMCQGLAAFYAESSKSTLGANTVDQLRKAELFAAQSDTFRRQYDDHMTNEGGQSGVVRHMDADVEPRLFRADLFWHRTRFR